MANGIHQYNIGRDRLSHGLLDGFTLEPDSTLRSGEGTQSSYVFLAGLDSAVEDCPWGRFTFRADIRGDGVLTVWAFASNSADVFHGEKRSSMDDFLLKTTVAPTEKTALFEAMGGVRVVGANDLLLHGQNGRWLWLGIEFSGSGMAALSSLRALTPSDNFYRTFPAVYQNDGEFFRRYLSIYSSLYSDIQDEVESLHNYLDLDTAPAAALPVLARWLGLKLDGNFLSEEHLRQLLRLAPKLIRAKGTRRAVELVAGLFVSEPVYLAERNHMERDPLVNRKLYGDSPYDFTLLISRHADELLRARLVYLIDQFKPLRSRANIVFLGEQCGLDTFIYLDLNAILLQPTHGRLDDSSAGMGTTCLAEESSGPAPVKNLIDKK